MDLEEFKLKYREFADEYDRILERDAFDCENLSELARNFSETWKTSCLDKIPFGSLRDSNFPECSPTQISDEDMCLLDRGNLSDQEDTIVTKNGSREIESFVSEEARICADIYRRLALATYLLTTLQKLRNNTVNPKERFEALQFARYAIRYNARDSKATFVFSLTLGWYLDAAGGGLEKVRLGRLFYHSLKYNIALEPTNALAHHLFGRYCLSVSQLSWIERALACKLFDSSELQYTTEDAEKSFRVAHSLDDKIAPTGLWMAKVFQTQKKPPREIVKWIEFGLKAKSREPINDIERTELEQFKKKRNY